MDAQTQAIHNAKAWQVRSAELARWAWARLVNRADHWAAILPHRKRASGQIAKMLKGKLKEHYLAKHFAGYHVRDLIGLPSMSAPGSRMSDIQPPRTCRWFAFDVGRRLGDGDGEPTRPGDNFHAALMWYEQLKQRHFEPVLEDLDGNGWYRVIVLLDEPIDVGCVCAFVDELVNCYADHWLMQRPTTFPDWPCIDGDGLDNWLALPGRQSPCEEMDYFSAIWDGNEWQRGHAAIDALVNTPTTPGMLLRRAEEHPGMDVGYQADALAKLTEQAATAADETPPRENRVGENTLDEDDVVGEIDLADQTALDTDADHDAAAAIEPAHEIELSGPGDVEAKANVEVESEPVLESKPRFVRALADDDTAGALADAFEQVAQVQTEEDDACEVEPTAAIAAPIDELTAAADPAEGHETADASSADGAGLISEAQTEAQTDRGDETTTPGHDTRQVLVRSLEGMDDDVKPGESPSLFEPAQEADAPQPVALKADAMEPITSGMDAAVAADPQAQATGTPTVDESPQPEHVATECRDRPPAIEAEPVSETEFASMTEPDRGNGLSDTAIETAFDALCDLVKEFGADPTGDGHAPRWIPIPAPDADHAPVEVNHCDSQNGNDAHDAHASTYDEHPHHAEENPAMTTDTQTPTMTESVAVAQPRTRTQAPAPSVMTDDARAMVEQIADRTGMREDQIVKRIFEWVGQQDEVVQAVILGQIPDAIRPDVWDLITKKREQGE